MRKTHCWKYVIVEIDLYCVTILESNLFKFAGCHSKLYLVSLAVTMDVTTCKALQVD